MRMSDAKIELEMLDAEGRRMGVGRASGPGVVHQGECIAEMRRAAGHRLSDPGEGNPNFMTMGFIIEKAIASYVYHQMDGIRPDPMLVDGVWQSPDFLATRHQPRVWDAKATWTSMNKIIKSQWTKRRATPEEAQANFEEYFWHMLVQLKGYCRSLGTLSGGLMMVFMNGDYSFQEPLGGPQFVPLEFEFSQSELDENWQRILNYRDVVLAGRAATRA